MKKYVVLILEVVISLYLVSSAKIKQSSKCGAMWIENPSTGKCYTFLAYKRTWNDARKKCVALAKDGSKQFKGDLASISSADEQEFIGKYLRKITDQTVWIGLTDKDRENTWKWSNGSPTNYTNWRQNEPNSDNNDENCVEIERGFDYPWNDVNCTHKVSALCEKVDICADPWIKDPSSGSCYQSIDKKLSWKQARKSCMSLKGDLVSITSRKEQNFINNMLRNSEPGPHWIGFNDISKEGRFEWTDRKTATFYNWGRKGQPDNRNNAEDCVVLYNRFYDNGVWHDYPCWKSYPSVCKKL